MKSKILLLIFPILAACSAGTKGTDAANEHYDKQMSEYGEITGVYEGVVTPPKENAITDAFPVQIQLYTATISKDGTPIVKLFGNYKRLDFDIPDATNRLLDVSYRNDRNPVEIYMSSSGGTSQIPDAYFMTLNGYLQNEVYTANFYDRRGFIGVLRAKKIR